MAKTDKLYIYREERDYSIKEPSKHITPIVSTFNRAICHKCKKNRTLCWCGLPYPTPVNGLYGRAQFDSDMDAIDKIDQNLSKLVAANVITGLECKRSEAALAIMRRRCAGKLFGTAKMLQDRDANKKNPSALTGKKEDFVKRDSHGVRLSTSEQNK